PVVEHVMGGKCRRVPWVADNTNTIESVIIHCRDFPYWSVFYPTLGSVPLNRRF
ncbi:MAG: hypothetical protein RLY17_429, partial [Pseudomonadota bacterium]